MCPTSWKIAGISLLVFGVGAAIRAGQEAPRADRNPAPVPTAAAEPAQTAAADEPGRRYHAVLKLLDAKIRINFPNDAPLEVVLKSIKDSTKGPNDSGLPIHVDPVGLAEVKKSMATPVNLDVEGIPLRESLSLLLSQLGLDYRVERDGRLLVSSRSAILEKENDDLKQQLAQARAVLKEVAPLAGSSSPSSHASTKPWGGLGGELEDPKTKWIRQKLEEPISMSFADESPLEDVLKYIKSATQGPNDTGIPIYVDPVGLAEAEKTMTSPVTLDLEGVPLRITLRLALKQLGLTYMVKDGLLTVNAESAEDQPIAIIEIVNKAKRGELTLDEVRALTELVEAVSELDRASQKLFGGGHAKK